MEPVVRKEAVLRNTSDVFYETGKIRLEKEQQFLNFGRYRQKENGEEEKICWQILTIDEKKHNEDGKDTSWGAEAPCADG